MNIFFSMLTYNDYILKVALESKEVETVMREVTTAVYIIYNCVSVQQKTTNNSWNYRGKNIYFLSLQ